MKVTRTIRNSALAALAAAATLGGATAAKAQDIVAILTCPMGCGVMEGNTIFGTLMAKGGESLIVAAQETPGYMYNVRAMAEERRWKKQVFGTEDVIIQLAMQGGGEELAQFLPEPIPIKFKLLHGESYWAQGKFFVTTNPDIKSIEDMKGKRISIGLIGQSDWGVFPYLLLKHVYGIDETNSDIRRLNPGGLTQQLIDGTTDVAVTGYGTDPDQQVHLITGPLRKLEASGKDLHYLGTSQEAIDQLNEKFGTTFVARTIKAGTLPSQDADFVSGFNRGYKAAHPDFSRGAGVPVRERRLQVRGRDAQAQRARSDYDRQDDARRTDRGERPPRRRPGLPGARHQGQPHGQRAGLLPAVGKSLTTRSAVRPDLGPDRFLSWEIRRTCTPADRGHAPPMRLQVLPL